MTIPFAFLYRDDITPSQKYLYAVLRHLALLDGTLSITRYGLEHSLHLTGSDPASDLTALVLSRDVDLTIVETSEGDLYEMQLAREAVAHAH